MVHEPHPLVRGKGWVVREVVTNNYITNRKQLANNRQAQKILLREFI